MGDERLRLFLALTLPDEVRERLARWQERELGQVGGIRLIPRSNLHVTLAFLGSTRADAVDGIVASMREAARAAGPLAFHVRRYRETRSVGMVAFVDEGGRGARLAGDLSGRLERLGVYEPEKREWLPHVTVVRFRERPRLVPELPALRTVSPSEVALYHSVLRPTGAQYEIRESVALGGS